MYQPLSFPQLNLLHNHKVKNLDIKTLFIKNLRSRIRGVGGHHDPSLRVTVPAEPGAVYWDAASSVTLKQPGPGRGCITAIARFMSLVALSPSAAF